MDFKDLTKEQIEEAKACKTTEERINFFVISIFIQKFSCVFF